MARRLATINTKPLLHIRSRAQKAFGETFGAATGVSDPRLQKIPIRNNDASGQAAAVVWPFALGEKTRFSGRCPELVCVAPLGQLAKLQTKGDALGFCMVPRWGLGRGHMLSVFFFGSAK